MTQRRFFIPPEAISADAAVIEGPEAHHIRKVLRLSPGALITLFDGTGRIYKARIEAVDRDTVKTSLLETCAIADDRPSLHLCMALLKGKKMDFIIQKATELGVSSIRPFLSDHSAAKPPGDSKENRWQRIALEACKQCNRPVPPNCLPLGDFSAVLETPGAFDSKLMLWEHEKEQSLGQIIKPSSPPGSVLFLVGPEGGFSETEHEQALAAGFMPVTLGSRTLRAETAGFAAMVILQFLLGNLGTESTGGNGL